MLYGLLGGAAQSDVYSSLQRGQMHIYVHVVAGRLRAYSRASRCRTFRSPQHDSISREERAGWADVVRCGGRASGPQLWWTVSQLRAKTIFRKLKSKLAAATLILLYLETNKIGAYSIETILLLYICYYKARPILGNIIIYIVVRGRL